MTIQDFINKFSAEIISEGADLMREIDGVYVSDLLSLAMANVTADNLWITVQTNMNILGIAALTDAACVVIAQGMNISENVIEKAKEEQICVLRVDTPVYEFCLELGKAL